MKLTPVSFVTPAATTTAAGAKSHAPVQPGRSRRAGWQLFTRRDLVRGGWLAGGALLGGKRAAAARLEIGPNLYQSIGVRPLVNCKGTFTIISGSLSLPEVKRAMEEASRHYVHLDELMDAVGNRLAELTGAEFGIVTAGCAAALAHATAACIAGADPEKLQRLPDLTGLKSEVIVPGYSRNVYDHAVRMLGVKIVDVQGLDELERAYTPRTAMIMLLGCPEDTGPFGLEPIARSARKRGVPVIVDAAAEHLTVPNVHLKRGAHMVAYSGGKCLRGPQCAGMLLGQKDLLKAAWLHSAPHHAFGRPMKVGKEEIMGMLAAVEAWMKRDHDAEWKTWQSWLDHIARRVTEVAGVTTEFLQPDGLSNRAPELRIRWDGGQLGIHGREAQKILYETEPRIVLGGATGSARRAGPSTITIMPYMMVPGDEKIAAERIYSVLSRPPKIDRQEPSADPPANVSGQWDVRMEFSLGSAGHVLVFEQQGASLVGTHQGDVLAGELEGVVEGNEIRFRSSHKYEGTRLNYEFTGTVRGDAMEGVVGLEEYGQARWFAERHKYDKPGGPVRPIKTKA